MPDTAENSSCVLNVYLNDIEVGTLTLLADDRTLFAFSKSYIDNPIRPVLGLWFKTPLSELKTTEKIRGGATLPPFFSNLLPEGHLRDYLAGKLNVTSGREFFLLAALGKDLPGAVRVQAPGEFWDDALEHKQSPFARRHLLRFSLAGIQLKFSAIMETTGGLTIPADGIGGSWIIKLPSYSYHHVPEAEYSMLKLAERVGIAVPDCRLIATESIADLPADINVKVGQSLAVKRFDRGDNGTRIHMEDFAQVFGIYPAEKYENASFDRIGYVILSECGEADFFEFIKRLVFTVMIGNGDMHLKNWSLLYKNASQPRLSPAYDFVPTIFYIPKDDLGLRLGGEREFLKIKMANFAKLASKAVASERMATKVVQETVEQIQEAWKDMRSDLPLDKEMKKLLGSYLRSLKPTSL